MRVIFDPYAPGKAKEDRRGYEAKAKYRVSPLRRQSAPPSVEMTWFLEGGKKRRVVNMAMHR
jgi:hypothetical protein